MNVKEKRYLVYHFTWMRRRRIQHLHRPLRSEQDCRNSLTAAARCMNCWGCPLDEKKNKLWEEEEKYLALQVLALKPPRW